MLIVISPAKTLDVESKPTTRAFTEPRLLDRSAELIELLVPRTPDELTLLLSISDALAELNAERYRDWTMPFTAKNARPAVFTFSGDTYVGLDAPATFDARDFTRAQKTLRILSGLYGVLRPLDLIQPYRLEMGTKLANPTGDDLYAFWGDTLTGMIAADLDAAPGGRFVVNLASNEYFRALHPDRIDAPIITPRFLDSPLGSRPGAKPKVISFHAKRARGAMAGWLVRERINSPRALRDFGDLGYTYAPDRSTPTEPTFVRHPNE